MGILWVMHFIPGLRLRVSERAEILGIDDAEMGESAYDYLGVEQEIGHTINTDLPLGRNMELQPIKSHSASSEKVDGRTT